MSTLTYTVEIPDGTMAVLIEAIEADLEYWRHTLLVRTRELRYRAATADRLGEYDQALEKYAAARDAHDILTKAVMNQGAQA